MLNSMQCAADCKCLVHTGGSILALVKLGDCSCVYNAQLHYTLLSCHLQVAEKPSPVFELCLLRASAIQRLAIRRELTEA